MLSKLLAESEVASILQISLAGLRRLRKAGEGPESVKVHARRILYRESDVEAWLERRVVRHADDGLIPTPAKKAPPEAELMEDGEAATLMGVSWDVLNEMRERGEGPVGKLDEDLGTYVYRRSEIHAWIDAKRTLPPL